MAARSEAVATPGPKNSVFMSVSLFSKFSVFIAKSPGKHIFESNDSYYTLLEM